MVKAGHVTYIERNYLSCPAPLHFERKEAVGGSNIEDPQTVEAIREAILGDNAAVVIDAVRHDAVAELDSVIPPIEALIVWRD